MILKQNQFSPIFSYSSIVSHNFIGNISKDRDKYRFRFELTFENGMTLKKQQSGFRTIKEVAYDCTVLEKYWNRMQKTVVTEEEVLVFPFVNLAQKIFPTEATISKEN